MLGACASTASTPFSTDFTEKLLFVIRCNFILVRSINTAKKYAAECGKDNLSDSAYFAMPIITVKQTKTSLVFKT